MASRLAEYLMSQPLYGAGQRVSQEGTSTAPVRSMWEGLARALQGGVGGLMQGYAMGQAKEEKGVDDDALAAYMADPSNPAKAAAASAHPSFPTVATSRMNMQERLESQRDAQRERDANRENMIRLAAALRPARGGGVDPMSRAEAQMEVLNHKATLEQQARERRTSAGLGALPLPGEPTPLTLPPVLPSTPVTPMLRPDKKAEIVPQEPAGTALPNPAPQPGMTPTSATPWMKASYIRGMPDGVASPTPDPAIVPAQATVPGLTPARNNAADPPIDMTGRTLYEGLPISNGLLKGVMVAKAAKNEDMVYKLHQEMMQEAIKYRHQELSGKNFEPMFNSRDVQVGSVNRTTNEQRFLPGMGPEGKPLSDNEQKRLAGMTGPTQELEQLTRSAPSKVGGYGVSLFGDIANALKRTFGDDKEGEAQWWQRYDMTANLQRNQTFGSALTAHEIAAWNKAAVNPAMKTEEINKNLARQSAIAKIATSRMAHALAIQGVNPKAIEAEIGYRFNDLPSPFARYVDPVDGTKPPPTAPSGAARAAPGGGAAGLPTADDVKAEIARRKAQQK